MLLLLCYSRYCQIFPFTLTLIFAPPPKYCHQPLALVISVNLLSGVTREAKCCLLHPLFLWLCSTQNSHLSIQVCFYFSYSVSLTTSLFPLTYDLWIVTVIFYFTFFYTVHVQSKVLFCHCPTSHQLMSMISLLIFSYSLVLLALTFKYTRLTPLLSLALMIHFSPHSPLPSDGSFITFFLFLPFHFALFLTHFLPIFPTDFIVTNVPLPQFFPWAIFS